MKRIIIQSLGAAVFGIGMFGLIAYSLGHPQWTALTGTVPIATPTAFATVLIGSAIFLIVHD